MAVAALSSASARRRLTVTAGATGVLLCALWFVPDAKATPHHRSSEPPSDTRSHTRPDSPDLPPDSRPDSVRSASAARGGESGGSSPYVIGGVVLGAGGALAVRSLRAGSPASDRPD